MTYFVIVEITKTLHGKTVSKYKKRIQIGFYETQDIDAIEDTFTDEGDERNDVPSQSAVVVNYFQTP